MAEGKRPALLQRHGAAIALLVAAGFGPTYVSGLPTPGLPWWVHLHGATTVSWIVLFAVQAWLVGRRELKLHRTLGWGGAILAVAIVPPGFATTMLYVRRDAVSPFFTPAGVMAADMVDLALVVAAVALRRRGEWHKRMLLSATVLLSWPALGRMVGTATHAPPLVIPVSLAFLLWRWRSWIPPTTSCRAGPFTPPIFGASARCWRRSRCTRWSRRARPCRRLRETCRADA